MDPCQNKVNIVSNMVFTHFRIRSIFGRINGYMDHMEVHNRDSASGCGCGVSTGRTAVCLSGCVSVCARVRCTCGPHVCACGCVGVRATLRPGPPH